MTIIKKGLVLTFSIIIGVSLAACTTPDEVGGVLAPAPVFTLEQLQASINFDTAEFITAEDGDVFISASPGFVPRVGSGTSFRSFDGPDSVWADAPPISHGSPSFTLFDAVVMPEGNLGILQIPRIDLTVNVYDVPDEVEAMRHGLAHLRETSAWVGNVGLAGHDSGEGDFFRNLNQLSEGDEIFFTTGLGTKTYRVVSSTVVHESDWSLFGMTEDNRLTLLTCVQFDRAQRLVVQAVQVY